jgi:hypothetical protein
LDFSGQIKITGGVNVHHITISADGPQHFGRRRRTIAIYRACAAGRVTYHREIVLTLIQLVPRRCTYKHRLAVRCDLDACRPIRIPWSRIIDVMPQLIAGRIQFYRDDGPKQVPIVSVSGEVDVSISIRYQFIPDFFVGFKFIVGWCYPRPLPYE